MPGLEIQDSEEAQHFLKHSLLCTSSYIKHFVESRSPAVLQKSLQKIDHATSWISRPIMTKVVSVGEPLIDQIDSRLSTVSKKLETSHFEIPQTLVSSAWFHELNAKVTPSLRTQLSNARHFYSVAMEQFIALKVRGDDGIHAYMAAIQKQLAVAENVWQERFAVPAKDFYEELSARYQQVAVSIQRTGTESVHEVRSRLQQVFDQRLEAIKLQVENARSLYLSALQHYVSFQNPTLVEVNEMIASYRQRMSPLVWNESLVQPLSELFISARKTLSAEELGELRRKLDASLPNYLPSSLHSHIQRDPESQHINVVQTCKAVVSGVGSSLTHVVSTAVQSRLNSVLSYSADQLNFYLPDLDDEDMTFCNDHLSSQPHSEEPGQDSLDLALPGEPVPSQNVTFGNLRHTVSKRVKRRLERSYSTIKEYSSERLSQIVHVDLIAYAESVIDGVKERATHLVENIPLDAALQQAQGALHTVKDLVQTQVNKSHQVVDQTRATLLSKVRAARQRSLAAFQIAVSIVQGTTAREIPDKSFHFMAQALGYEEKDEHYDAFVSKVKLLVNALRQLVVLSEESSSVMMQKQEVSERPEGGEADSPQVNSEGAESSEAILLTQLQQPDQAESPDQSTDHIW